MIRSVEVRARPLAGELRGVVIKHYFSKCIESVKAAARTVGRPAANVFGQCLPLFEPASGVSHFLVLLPLHLLSLVPRKCKGEDVVSHTDPKLCCHRHRRTEEEAARARKQLHCRRGEQAELSASWLQNSRTAFFWLLLALRFWYAGALCTCLLLLQRAWRSIAGAAMAGGRLLWVAVGMGLGVLITLGMLNMELLSSATNSPMLASSICATAAHGAEWGYEADPDENTYRPEVRETLPHSVVRDQMLTKVIDK